MVCFIKAFEWHTKTPSTPYIRNILIRFCTTVISFHSLYFRLIRTIKKSVTLFVILRTHSRSRAWKRVPGLKIGNAPLKLTRKFMHLSTISMTNKTVIFAVNIGGCPALNIRKAPFNLTRKFRRLSTVSMTNKTVIFAVNIGGCPGPKIGNASFKLTRKFRHSSTFFMTNKTVIFAVIIGGCPVALKSGKHPSN